MSAQTAPERKVQLQLQSTMDEELVGLVGVVGLRIRPF